MIVITGAAGFIGSNIYQSLKNDYKIIRVDFDDECVDPYDFLDRLKDPEFASSISAILHQGACTDTMCYDVKYMMDRNLEYSMELFKLCMKQNIRLIYASTAALYGDGPDFKETDIHSPKNVYAVSKSLFDQYVESFLETGINNQVVGLRYFNVYGPGEHRKGKMSSVLHQFKNQIDQTGKIKLFENSSEYRRDFIYVDDVVSVNKHFLQNEKISGIFNCGTGQPHSFLDIANYLGEIIDLEINYVPMPFMLKEKYQEYTCANLNKLREIGKYDKNFLDPKKGIARYRAFWDGK